MTSSDQFRHAFPSQPVLPPLAEGVARLNDGTLTNAACPEAADGLRQVIVEEGLFETAVLAHTADLLRQVAVRHVKTTTRPDQPYSQPEGYRLRTAASSSELRELIAERAARVRTTIPELKAIVDDIEDRVARIDPGDRGVEALWEDYVDLLESLPERYLELGPREMSLCRVGFASGRLLLAVNVRDMSESAGCSDFSVPAFLAAVAGVRKAQRVAGRAMTVEELAALHVAYRYLEEGFRAPLPYMTWGQPGFRTHQTLMSVTDPGEGHLDGTTASSKNLDGVIVHVEHLERGTDEDRQAVEAYRIPYPHTVAQVRLNVADDAPCSSYVGRPVFEGGPRHGMLKTVHTLAAACSAILMDGLSECKLAIEGMTASEAIQFMRAMVAAVRRDRHTQVLAAAFNLNTAITDDRPETLRASGGAARLVTDPVEIGLLGIQLTELGGFDKVTWDGAANTYPSRCVMEQISFSDALMFVHRAHERGLLTYFSAGFRVHHLASAIFTGVDGIGVGGAQILRYMDRHTGHHGPFIEENIAAILDVRNRSEDSARGRAARLLARLDRMRFETSITLDEDQRRRALFQCMLRPERFDDRSLVALLEPLERVHAFNGDAEHPVMAWMARLEHAGRASLAAQALPAQEWWETMARLRQLADRRDIVALGQRLRELRLRVEETLFDGRERSVTPALTSLSATSGSNVTEDAA